jgi:hypothetical protein
MDTLNLAYVSLSALDILEPFVESIFKLAKEWREDNKAYKPDERDSFQV